MGEDGSFLYTYTDFQLISWDMLTLVIIRKWITYWLHCRNISHVMFDHDLEVNVNFDALSLVQLYSLSLLLFEVIHLLSAFLTVLLKTFDFLQTWRLLRVHRWHWQVACKHIICAILQRRVIDSHWGGYEWDTYMHRLECKWSYHSVS
jgi:hypothetical protein